MYNIIDRTERANRSREHRPHLQGHTWRGTDVAVKCMSPRVLRLQPQRRRLLRPGAPHPLPAAPRLRAPADGRMPPPARPCVGCHWAPPHHPQRFAPWPEQHPAAPRPSDIYTSALHPGEACVGGGHCAGNAVPPRAEAEGCAPGPQAEQRVLRWRTACEGGRFRPCTAP